MCVSLNWSEAVSQLTHFQVDRLSFFLNCIGTTVKLEFGSGFKIAILHILVSYHNSWSGIEWYKVENLRGSQC